MNHNRFYVLCKCRDKMKRNVCYNKSYHLNVEWQIHIASEIENNCSSLIFH